MIRRATIKDLDAIYSLGQRAHALSRYAPIRIDGLQAKTNLLAMMHNRAQCVFVAEDDQGEVIGVLMGISVPWFFSREAYATDVFTYAASGMVGALLIRRFMRWAFLERHVPSIEVACSFGGTEAQKARAERLYTRLGFQKIGSYFSLRRPIEQTAAKAA